MSFTKRAIAGFAAGAAALLMLPQAALAGVVVSSSGPSASQFPVGKQIDDTERFTLSDGDRLTVLDNGGTRVFSGSGTYMLSRSTGTRRNSAFSSLTSSSNARRARTGTTRTANVGAISNPKIFYVDVAATGPICIADLDNVRLWRADTQAESTYTITADGVETNITFPEGEMLAAWDIYNPPVVGTEYQIGLGANASEISFVELEEVPANPEDMANALITNGCLVQLDQMSKAMMGG